MTYILKTRDLSNLSADLIKSELSRFGIAMKSKQNRKLYERLLLEMYAYVQTGVLPDYL